MGWKSRLRHACRGPGCGARHEIFWPGAEIPASLKKYRYECPTAKTAHWFTHMEAWEETAVQPPGSVTVSELDDAPLRANLTPIIMAVGKVRQAATALRQARERRGPCAPALSDFRQAAQDVREAAEAEIASLGSHSARPAIVAPPDPGIDGALSRLDGVLGDVQRTQATPAAYSACGGELRRLVVACNFLLAAIATEGV